MIDLVRKEMEVGNYLLQGGLINRYAHSVELFTSPNRGGLYPVYRSGDEFIYFGVDDTKGRFAYFRLNGSPTPAGQPLRISSCTKTYLMDFPIRLVIFNDWEKENHAQLITKFLAVGFINNVTLSRFTANAVQLAKDESPIGDFDFGAKTFYLAIDLIIQTELKPSTCIEVCDPFKNPIFSS